MGGGIWKTFHISLRVGFERDRGIGVRGASGKEYGVGQGIRETFHD